MQKPWYKLSPPQIWFKFAPFWHVGVFLVMAVLYLATFVTLPARVDALEGKLSKVDLLNQRVEDIAQFIGVPKRAAP